MKHIIRKSILFCAIVAGNMWAMEEEKPDQTKKVQVRVCNTDESWNDFTLAIHLGVSKNAGINEQIYAYFGINAQSAANNKISIMNSHKDTYEMSLPDAEYERLENIKCNNMLCRLLNHLHINRQSTDVMNESLENRNVWIITEFGKDSLKSSVEYFFDKDLPSTQMHAALEAMDEIAYAIGDNKNIAAENKQIWQEMVRAVDFFLQERIGNLLFDSNLLAADDDDEKGDKPAGAIRVIGKTDLHDMQFLAYALEHARENSEHKSLIIGSWFNEKLSTLTPDELNLIIKRVNLWLGHYQAIPKHFENIRDEKQQVEASLVRSALLKKAGWGALAIGVSVAAYQLYQYLYNTPADEQPETAQA